MLPNNTNNTIPWNKGFFSKDAISKSKLKIKVYGGRYGLSSKDTTPGDILAVFDNLDSKEPIDSFTIGIIDDVTNKSLERKEIKVYHVQGEIKENDIGYILLETFDEGASVEFIQKFNELKAKGAKKLIIDLRYNTGGLLEECTAIADYMLDKDDTILITIDAEGKKDYFKSENKEKPIDMDIVVLVNDYSASASEVLAGALKDNGEAKIVGEKTYGKGVIQSVFALADGSVLKLTISEYLTPNETKINKIGIIPDEEVHINLDVPEGEEVVDSQLNRAIEILKGK